MKNRSLSIISCLSTVLVAYAQAISQNGMRSVFKPVAPTASKRNLLMLAKDILINKGATLELISYAISLQDDDFYLNAENIKQAFRFLDLIKDFDSAAGHVHLAFIFEYLDQFGEEFEISPRISQASNLCVLEKSIHLRLVAA